MRIHTTNYNNAFIIIADDCPTSHGEIPPAKTDKKTIATMQFEIISQHPYEFTSDDVLFKVFANRNDLSKNEYKETREHFFRKDSHALELHH